MAIPLGRARRGEGRRSAATIGTTRDRLAVGRESPPRGSRSTRPRRESARRWRPEGLRADRSSRPRPGGGTGSCWPAGRSGPASAPRSGARCRGRRTGRPAADHERRASRPPPATPSRRARRTSGVRWISQSARPPAAVTVATPNASRLNPWGASRRRAWPRSEAIRDSRVRASGTLPLGRPGPPDAGGPSRASRIYLYHLRPLSRSRP